MSTEYKDTGFWLKHWCNSNNDIVCPVKGCGTTFSIRRHLDELKAHMARNAFGMEVEDVEHAIVSKMFDQRHCCQCSDSFGSYFNLVGHERYSHNIPSYLCRVTTMKGFIEFARTTDLTGINAPGIPFQQEAQRLIACRVAFIIEKRFWYHDFMMGADVPVSIDDRVARCRKIYAPACRIDQLDLHWYRPVPPQQFLGWLGDHHECEMSSEEHHQKYTPAVQRDVLELRQKFENCEI